MCGMAFCFEIIGATESIALQWGTSNCLSGSHRDGSGSDPLLPRAWGRLILDKVNPQGEDLH